MLITEFSHAEYVEAAKQCLELEQELNKLLEENPELLAELEAEQAAAAAAAAGGGEQAASASAMQSTRAQSQERHRPTATAKTRARVVRDTKVLRLQCKVV